MPKTLVLGFELLKALAAIDIVEAKFEDSIEVVSAFLDVGIWALGPRKIFIVVEPELSLFGSAIAPWTFDASKDSAFDFGAWVRVRSPELDSVMNAHC